MKTTQTVLETATALAAAACLVFAAGAWASEYPVEKHPVQHPQESELHSEDAQQGQMTGSNTMMMGQMPDMRGMIDNMTAMAQRSDDLSKRLAKIMTSQHGEIGDGIQGVRQMSLSIGSMARQMKDNMERYDDMVQNMALMGDNTIQEQMQNFRAHIEEMSTQMGQALDSVQTMTKKLEHQYSGK